MPYYCPNCSALLEDPDTSNCPKCGFDRVAARLEEERVEEEKERKSMGIEEDEKEGDLSSIRSDSFGELHKCPICKTGLSKMEENAISFDLLGKDVTIHNIRIMGMNLHKRAITQCIVNFEGYICENSHRFFTSYKQIYKELCPICRDTMKKFGVQVRTCSHCHINISGDDYLKMDGRELLEDEGWIYKPELLEA